MSRSLVATGLTKRYGETVVLQRLDLRVSAGEVVLIRGPNGAGKSTLLRLLAGIERPDSGRVTIEDRHQRRNAMRRVLVPQEATTFDHLRVAECFQLYQVELALANRQFGDESNRLCRELSAGRRKALNVALAAGIEASAVLLDEPEAGLDDATEEVVCGMIERLRQSGQIVVAATHRPSRVLRKMASRELWLSEGRLHSGEADPTSTLLESSWRLPDAAQQPLLGRLQVMDLTVERTGRPVLSRVSFSVSPGTLLWVQGPNGSGKSSLGLALAGILQATGQVLLDGRDITKMSPSERVRRGLVCVTQAPDGVFPGLSVLENLKAVARDDGAGLCSLAITWQEFPELRENAGTKCLELSGGVRRLLALAMGLRLHPRVLILDEPFAHMSEQLSLRILRLLHRLRNTLAIIIFEHDCQAFADVHVLPIALSTLQSPERGVLQ